MLKSCCQYPMKHGSLISQWNQPSSTPGQHTPGARNQDPRSWYLVANFLLLCAHDLLHTKAPSPQEVDQLEAALTCFAMLLPASLDLQRPLSFTETTYRRSNWVVSTHIMLQGAFIFCRFINAREAPRPLSNSINRLLALLAAGSQFQARTADYQSNAEQVFAAVRSWNPQYIGLHNPFMACLVVGPAAINLRVALDSKKEDAASSLTGLEVDLLILTLKRVARFWNFGSILLGSNPKGAWQSGTSSMTHTFVFLKRYIPHRIMGISNCLCAGYTPC